MKPILSLLPLCLLVAGCANEVIETGMEPTTEHKGFTPVGNPVEVRFNITSTPFENGISTRAEEPVEYTPQNLKEQDAIEKENVMRTFWIFEFDQETHELIHEPYYAERGNDTGSETFYHGCAMSDNGGKEVIIYAVVNIDGNNQSDAAANWCKYNEVTGEYDGFMTMEQLEAQLLPTAYEYGAVQSSATWPPYYATHRGNTYLTGIPKSGKKEHQIVKEDAVLEVVVTNMYAKLLVYSKGGDASMGGYYFNVVVENIPCYCRVGALATEETTTAFNYPDGVHWTWFANAISCTQVSQDEYTGVEGGTDIDSGGTEPPLLIVYVPENIQGENGSAEASRNENVPELADASAKDYDEFTYTYIKGFNSVESATDAMAVHLGVTMNLVASPGYYGPIYPGGNNTTNFNVRRNNSYRLIFNFGSAEEE